MTSQFFAIALRYCSRKFSIERMLINFNEDDFEVKIVYFNFIKNIINCISQRKSMHECMHEWTHGCMNGCMNALMKA